MLLNANNIIENLKKVLNVKSNKELAIELGVKPNTISSWKQRNSVDYKLLIELSCKKKFDINYLFKGETASTQHQEIKPTPYIPIRYIHQYTIGLINDISLMPSINFSKTNIPTRIFQVPTNNMEPLITQNGYVACQEISAQDLYEGALVVIVSRKKGFYLNRISRITGDKVILENERHNTLLKNRYIKFNLRDADEIWNIDSIGYIVNKTNIWSWDI